MSKFRFRAFTDDGETQIMRRFVNIAGHPSAIRFINEAKLIAGQGVKTWICTMDDNRPLTDREILQLEKEQGYVPETPPHVGFIRDITKQ